MEYNDIYDAAADYSAVVHEVPVSNQELLDISKKRNFNKMKESGGNQQVTLMDSPVSAKRAKIDENPSTLAKLLLKPELSDITIHVRGKARSCFRSVLAAQSDILRSLMFGDCNKMVGHHLNISDITPNAFDFIRMFAHDMNPKLDMKNIVEVTIAAEKYAVDEIRAQCKAFMARVDNVNDLLLIVKGLGDNGMQCQYLVESHADLLRANGGAIMISEVFQSMPFQTAKQIIQSDDLGVTEEVVFEAIKHWINEENVYELKQMIRFGRMNAKFIYSAVKETGILNDAELVSLYEKELGLTDERLFSSKERNIAVPKRKRGCAGSKKKAVRVTKTSTATKSKTKKTRQTTKKRSKKKKK